MDFTFHQLRQKTTTKLLVNLSETTSMCNQGSCTFFQNQFANLPFSDVIHGCFILCVVQCEQCLVAFIQLFSGTDWNFGSGCSFRKRNYPFRVRRSKTMLANDWFFVTSNFPATDIAGKTRRQNPSTNNVWHSLLTSLYLGSKI